MFRQSSRGLFQSDSAGHSRDEGQGESAVLSALGDYRSNIFRRQHGHPLRCVEREPHEAPGDGTRVDRAVFAQGAQHERAEAASENRNRRLLARACLGLVYHQERWPEDADHRRPPASVHPASASPFTRG